MTTRILEPPARHRSRPDAGPAYYDISPEVSERIGVFPEDTPFSHQVVLDFPGGGNLLLSRMVSTLHLGAHADAPTTTIAAERPLPSGRFTTIAAPARGSRSARRRAEEFLRDYPRPSTTTVRPSRFLRSTL